MTPSIPVADFVRPVRGSRPWDALHRANRLKPTVELVGEIRGERYFRVQCEGRDRHCVILWADKVSSEPVSKCDCEAHYVPHTPMHCYHIAAVLIWESKDGESNTPREKEPVPADAGCTCASKDGRPDFRQI